MHELIYFGAEVRGAYIAAAWGTTGSPRLLGTILLL